MCDEISGGGVSLHSMTKAKPTAWEIKPHTIAKHALLKAYLNAWFPILGTSEQRVIFLDGFAGPGVYKDGQPGSPIIAIDHTAAA